MPWLESLRLTSSGAEAKSRGEAKRGLAARKCWVSCPAKETGTRNQWKRARGQKKIIWVSTSKVLLSYANKHEQN